MPKIKMPVKSPHIDMTPMVDLFSLLLTFFMLTTSFRPPEAAVIDSPFSISEKTAPDANLITISVSKDNKIFLHARFGLGDDPLDQSAGFSKPYISQQSQKSH